jgi:hypothetical protein
MGLAQAGMAYIEIGYGLHPGLAFPMAVLSLMVLIPVWACILTDDPFDVDLPEDDTEVWLVHSTVHETHQYHPLRHPDAKTCGQCIVT